MPGRRARPRDLHRPRGLVGLSLGLVGGGGSILTVPLLVGVLGVPAREATTMSLIVVGISAAWATLPHARRGNVLWQRALLFGVVGIVGTAIGGYLNREVPSNELLAAFVVLMVVAAIATWRRARLQEHTAERPVTELELFRRRRCRSTRRGPACARCCRLRARSSTSARSS